MGALHTRWRITAPATNLSDGTTGRSTTGCLASSGVLSGRPKREAAPLASVSRHATLKLLSEEETGAENCQHDHPTIGEEYIFDWLADRFGIDQRELVGR